MLCLQEINLRVPQIVLEKSLLMLHQHYVDRLGKLEPKTNRKDTHWVEVSHALGTNPSDTDHEKLDTLIGEKCQSFRERFFQVHQKWNQDIAIFEEYLAPELLKKTILSILPDSIRSLDPAIGLQIVRKTGIIPPHIDHNRQSTILIVLETNHEITRWWKPIKQFETFENLQYADLDCVEEIYSHELEAKKCYIFNNSIYHSVHPTDQFGNSSRSAITIEFSNISAQDLYSLYNLDRSC